MKLLDVAINAAVSATVPGPILRLNGAPRNLTVQATFDPGTGGGTSVDAYLQTTLDSGKNWDDIANFHFTSSAARKLVNFVADHSVPAQVDGTDGGLAANTSIDGILGPAFQVKFKSSGVYSGASLRIDVGGVDIPADPWSAT